MAEKQEKNENVPMQIDENLAQNKKIQSQAMNHEIEQNKKQESRMMNFFNQEFLDRKIDFKPK